MHFTSGLDLYVRCSYGSQAVRPADNRAVSDKDLSSGDCGTIYACSRADADHVYHQKPAMDRLPHAHTLPEIRFLIEKLG